MKKTILTFLAVITVTALIGQDLRFQKGDKVFNIGIGFGSTLYSGSFYTTTIPPLSASLELGFMDDLLDVENLSLGLGGYFGFTSAKYEYKGIFSTWGWEYTSIIVGARGALHYPFIDKFDTYTGLMLGYNIVTSKSIGDVTGSASASGLSWSYYIGGRYYFTDNLAAMIELGYGIAYLNVGLGIKF